MIKIINKEFIESIYNDFEKIIYEFSNTTKQIDIIFIKKIILPLYKIEEVSTSNKYLYFDNFKTIYKYNDCKTIYYNPLNDIIDYIYSLYKSYMYLKINDKSLKSNIIEMCYKDLNKDIMLYQIEHIDKEFIILNASKKNKYKEP